MISITGLTKTFGGLKAVDKLNMQLHEGEIVGFLGPNGAGKTTTLRMLYGLVPPDEGEIKLRDKRLTVTDVKARQSLGILADNSGLYDRLSARENIVYFGRLYGVVDELIQTRMKTLVEQLDMHDIIDRRTRGFSQGQRVKVNLTKALIHDPDYLFLDEPTNGLDVPTTLAVRQLLLQLKSLGKGILFSSHLMHEVDKLCDRLVIISRGRIIAEGSVDHIISQAKASNLERAFVSLTQA